MWTLLRAIAICVFAAAVVSAARTYDITNAQFSISTFDGSSRLKVQADSAAAYNMPKQVAEADDVYRFTAAITANGRLNEETLPHQAWIVVDDSESAAAVWPLRVRSTGVVSWSMRVDRMPAAVKNAIATRGPKWPFRISLMVGSFGASVAAQPEPLELQIAELSFPAAALSRIEPAPNARDAREAEEGFKPWPDHKHTFAEAPWLKMPPRAVSAAIAIAVALGPWFILVQMVRDC